jgi:hypothetical protein
MASKFTCVCGNVVRTNLYEGHGLQLLVSEELTDLPDPELSQPCGAFVDKLVRESIVVAKCRNCGILALVNNEYGIELYAPVSQ